MEKEETHNLKPQTAQAIGLCEHCQPSRLQVFFSFRVYKVLQLGVKVSDKFLPCTF